MSAKPPELSLVIPCYNECDDMFWVLWPNAPSRDFSQREHFLKQQIAALPDNGVITGPVEAACLRGHRATGIFSRFRHFTATATASGKDIGHFCPNRANEWCWTVST